MLGLHTTEHLSPLPEEPKGVSHDNVEFLRLTRLVRAGFVADEPMPRNSGFGLDRPTPVSGCMSMIRWARS